jgi:hypothetical protein
VGRFDEAIVEAKQAQFFDPLSPIINADLERLCLMGCS